MSSTPTPLANLQKTMTSAQTSADRVNHKFQRAHGRVLRVQTLAAQNQQQFLLSVLLPPLGVYRKLGFAPEMIMNVLLTLMGFVPGIVHVLYILTND